MYIKLENISKVYKEKIETSFITDLFKPKFKTFNALDSISLTINSGELVGILGRNGAGKSTLIKILCGLITPSNGTVEILGKPILKFNSAIFNDIAVVFGQKSSLWWDLPLKDSINATKNIYNLNNSEFNKQKDFLIEALNLNDIINRPVRNLSLGEKVKGEIAFNLMHKPKLLLLDEPTIGLDIVSKFKLRKFLKELVADNQTSIILASHDTGDIEYCCNRVCIIEQGNIEFDGTIDKFKSYMTNESMLVIDFNDQKLDENIIKKIKKQNGVITANVDINFNKINIIYSPNITDSLTFMNNIRNSFDNCNSLTFSEKPPSFEDVLLKRFMNKNTE